MANNKFDLQAFFDNMEGKTWSLGSAFKRADALPLDLYSVWENKEDAVEYAATHATAYPGQTLIVVEQEGEGEAAVDKIKLYYIDENRELQEVGSATLGDDTTIVLDPETKTLSLKGFAEAGTETKLIKNKDGVLEWAADSQAALDADLTDLKSDVEAIDDRVEAVEGAIAGLGDIVNFAGVVDDIANKPASGYEPGDIVIEKKTTGDKTVITEYICSKNAEGNNEWVSLGDPEGVVALQGRMDIAEQDITDLESAIGDLEEFIGDLPTNEDPYDNVIDYIDRQDAVTLSSAKSYADGKVEELATGQVNTNKEAISTINGQITDINSSIEGLGTNKADKATFEEYVSTNNAAVANKLDKTEAASTYLTQDSASTLYYTNAKATNLESEFGVVKTTVNELDVTDSETGKTIKGKGNVQLRTDLDALTVQVNTNTGNITANANAIAADGQAIIALQGRAKALEDKDAEHTSAIGTNSTNIAENKAAIEVIYSVDGEGKATGVLVDEIKKVTDAEGELAKDLEAEVDRATKAENAIADRVTDLESHKTQIDGRADDLSDAIDTINNTTLPKLDTDLKKYSDDNLQTGKDYTDEQITEVNSKVGDIEKEIGSLANVMHFAGVLAAGGDYHIASITEIAATADTDEGLTIVSTKSFDKGDVGIYNQKEYVCIVIDDATEDEVFTSTWTAIGDVGATSALIDGLEKNKLDKSEFETYKTETLTPKFNAIDQAITDANSAIAGEQERAEGVEEDLAGRLDAVEAKASTNETNIATNVTNIAANAKAIEDLDTELTSYIENLLEWGSFDPTE